MDKATTMKDHTIPSGIPTVTPYMFSIDTSSGHWSPEIFAKIRALLGDHVELQGPILYAVPHADHDIKTIIAGLRSILGVQFQGAISLGNLVELKLQRTNMASPNE